MRPVVTLRQLGQVLVDEALVVAQVEVRLGAIVSDEDLAVLVRRHRARINVDVRIELDDADREPAALEQATDAGGGDAFAERGGHASSHKDILRHSCGTSAIGWASRGHGTQAGRPIRSAREVILAY